MQKLEFKFLSAGLTQPLALWGRGSAYNSSQHIKAAKEVAGAGQHPQKRPPKLGVRAVGTHSESTEQGKI